MYQQPRLIYSVSFGLAALIIAAKGDASPTSQLLVAAAAGALIGLGNRLWIAALGAALLAWAVTHHAAVSPALWLIAFTLLAGAFGLRPRLGRPGRAAAAAPVLIALALWPVSQLVSSGVGGWAGPFLTLLCAGAALYGSWMIAAMIADAAATAILPAAPDRVGVIARPLLLGRIVPGLSHDLRQSLNVITMANSNLAYIVDQLDLSPDERSQLTARIARIATHSETAANILGLFRWFGKDEARDKEAMTVGSALERAIAAVEPQARSAGMSIELRGDALDFPALARQGAIEMIAVAALLDTLAATSDDDVGAPVGRIILNATHDGGEVAVRLLCERMAPEQMRRSAIDKVTLELASDFAGHCGGRVRHVRRRNDPVQMEIWLKRATI